MSIFEDIKTDAKQALRDHQPETVVALRSGIAAIQEKCANQEERTNPPDELAAAALKSHIKKLRKATKMQLTAELHGQYMREILYLEEFLPAEEISADCADAVAAAVEELGAAGDPKMTGRVIGHIMKQGKAFDGAEVSRLVREACTPSAS